MSSRYISVEEINSILAAIEDENGIKLLKDIRDKIKGELKERKESKIGEGRKLSAEEQQKEQQEEAQEKAFVGFTKEEDLDVKDDDGKLGTLKRLEEQGLLVKGGFIPRGEERINTYKLTNEGFALLYLVDKINKGGSNNNPTRKPYQEKKEDEELPQQQREARKQEREEQRSTRLK